MPRVRSSCVVDEPKSEVAELALSRKHHNDAIQQISDRAATEKSMSKPRKIQTIEIEELGRALRIGNEKPKVRLSSTMKLVTDTAEVGLLLRNSRVDRKRLAAGN